MNSGNTSLQESLEARRQTIKEQWYRAIIPTTQTLTAEEKLQIQNTLDQIINCLIAETFSPDQAQDLGASLASLLSLNVDTFRSKLEVMILEISQIVPAEQGAALQPRLTRLTIELALGFSQHLADLYRILIENTNDFVVVVQDERTIYRNQAYAQIVDSTAPGQHFLDVVAPEDRERVLDYYEKRQAGQPVPDRYEADIITKEGERRTLEINPRVFHYRDRPASMAVMRDVSAHKQAEEALQRRNEQLEALSTVGLKIIAQLDLNNLLNVIVTQAVELLNGCAGNLFLHRPDQDVMESTVALGEAYQVGDTFQKGEGLCGQVWGTGEVLIEEVTDIEAPHKSIGVPIRWSDFFLGVLIVQVEIEDIISASAVKSLSIFATQTAIAIRNARLYEQEQKRAKQMAVVNRVGRKVVSTLDPQQLMQDIVNEIQRSFEYYNVIILLVDFEKQELGNQAVAGGFAKLAPPDYRQPVGEGIIGHVAQTGEALLVNDIDQDPRYIVGFKEKVQTRSELSIPLKRAGQIIGVLDVQEPTVNAFDETDVIALETLADQIAMAIDNARLYQQAQQDAETKSVLLREINHRVKNNLTAIIGLIYTEQERLAKEHRPVYKSIMQNLINRIEGLAIAHSLLSASEWQALSLNELVNEVIRAALPALPPGKRINIDVSPSEAMISPHQAQNIALIISELMTNTIKHALQDKDVVNVVVDIETDEDVIQMTFKNDGPGYDRAILEEAHYPGGLELVKNIIESNLRGTFSVKNEHGPLTVMRFSTP